MRREGESPLTLVRRKEPLAMNPSYSQVGLAGCAIIR